MAKNVFSQRGAQMNRMPKVGSVVRTLPVSMFAFWGMQTVALAACNTELKPTDRYKELSAMLKCIVAELEELKARDGSDAKEKVAPATLEELRESEPGENCLLVSLLPKASRIVLKQGMTLCRDNGAAWLTVKSANPESSRYTTRVDFAQLGKGTVSCYGTSPNCKLTDEVTGLKLLLDVKTEVGNGEQIVTGVLRRAKADASTAE